VTSEATSEAAALALARQCAAAMWADDQASRRLGMELLDVAPGRSRLRMTVRQDMVNGHGSCHGGFLATLADSAFAFACNTYDQVTVASGFDITFVAPAGLGDVLVADAVERARFGRSGLYDVTVSCRRETSSVVIAEFRGRSRSLHRPHLPSSRLDTLDATPPTPDQTSNLVDRSAP